MKSDEANGSTPGITPKTRRRGTLKPKARPRGKAFAPGNKPKNAWKKGQSGNPAGRPPLPPELKEAFEVLSVEAIDVLREIIHNEKHPRREQACEYAINRKAGTPPTSVQLSGPNGKPLGPGDVAVRFTVVEVPASAAETEKDDAGDSG